MLNHRHAFAAPLLALVVSACSDAAFSPTEPAVPDTATVDKPGAAIADALAALPRARVALAADDGVPRFLTGQLGVLDVEGSQRTADLSRALAAIAPVFGARAEDLVVDEAITDPTGDVHLRIVQQKNGLPVFGGDLRLHVRGGTIYAANGSVRDDVEAPAEPAIDAASAASFALRDAASPRDATSPGAPRLGYHRSGGKLALVWAVDVTGTQPSGAPVADTVLVDARRGVIVDRQGHVHALNREVRDSDYQWSMPSPLARAEGQPPTGISVVDTNYDHIGKALACLSGMFGRDSFDGAGAKVVSTVRFIEGCNAIWNNTTNEVMFGRSKNDGYCEETSNALDVVAHEIGHGVTGFTSRLGVSGEPGAINEALSDTFAVACEWYTKGVEDGGTWRIGEDVWLPAGTAIRYLDDPAYDNHDENVFFGGSIDWYPDYDSGATAHDAAGVANHAFFLLSKGGKHRRNKSNIVVSPIGVLKAAKIFHHANAYLIDSQTGFAGLKIATEIAAQQLVGQHGIVAGDAASVTAAWQAVGVGITPAVQATTLVNRQAVPGLSDATGSTRHFVLDVPPGATNLELSIAGAPGAGDADLYVQWADTPTTTAYDCRPYKASSSETCSFASPMAGRYYVMLRGYSAYQGVTLGVSYTAGLANGVDVKGLAGPQGSAYSWTYDVPAGSTSVSFTTGGGAGNVDLLVRRGTLVTQYSHDCKSASATTSESCTLTNTGPATYYVMLVGSGSYAGVTLKAASF